jgi:hypothetical protein
MPDPIRIDDEENADWLHRQGNDAVIQVLKEGQVLASVNLESSSVESSDSSLEELLYQLMDEGLPSGEQLTQENIGNALAQYGYEVKA